MAQETPIELAQRLAKEKAAATAAAAAQQKADQTAAVDPKVAASKAQQEAEEAAADARARQEQAVALAASNSANAGLLGGVGAGSVVGGGVPAVTPNAVGQQGVNAVAQPQAVALTGALDPIVLERTTGWKTYQHQYANANTIMPNGKKLIFGGQNGHIGQYSTNVPAQIEHLDDLARTPGSMVTEVRKDPEGRYIVVTDTVLLAEQQAALIDSRTNSAADLNPNVVTARANLPRQIAADS